jgi:hypothetical protein
MTQALYAHMNNKKIKIKKKKRKNPSQKRVGGVAQDVGPEFKPQYQKIKKGFENVPNTEMEERVNIKITLY